MATALVISTQTFLSKAKVIVELKAVKAIAPEHQAQLINYLRPPASKSAC